MSISHVFGAMNVPCIHLMIAAAQKAGTSSLLAYIGQHPDITIHNEREFSYFVVDELYQQGYERSFSRLYGSKDATSKVIAAKSAALMYFEAACQRLYEHNPDALIVLILRNPIRRAYSAYWHWRRRGFEAARTFETALDMEQVRLADGSDKWRRMAYVNNGIYLPHVIRLKEQFGDDRVLVYTTEDLRNRPLATVQEIFRHAGVDGSFEPNVVGRHNAAAKPRSETLANLFGSIVMSQSKTKLVAKRVLPKRLVRRTMNAIYSLNDERFTPPPMASDTYARLLEIFARPNLELETLLGRDLSDWNAPMHEPADTDDSLSKEDTRSEQSC